MALSGLNCSILAACLFMSRQLFKVDVFILPLLFPFVSFIAENAVSLFNEVGGKLNIKSNSPRTFSNP